MAGRINRTVRGTLVAGALLLSACGGSSDGDDPDSAASAEESTTTEAPTTTQAPTTTTEAPTTTTEVLLEGDPNDPQVIAFCIASADADAAGQVPIDGVGSFQDVFDIQIALIDGITPPEVIASDLQTVREGLQEMRDALDSVDDVDDVGPVLDAIAENERFEVAGARLEAFSDASCPETETSSPSTTDNPSGLTDDDIREALSTDAGRQGIAAGVVTTSSLTQEEALCFVEMTDPDVIIELFSLGTGQTTEPSTDTQIGLLAGLEACGLDISAFG